jgi:ribose transport system substrate-binding protein
MSKLNARIHAAGGSGPRSTSGELKRRPSRSRRLLTTGAGLALVAATLVACSASGSQPSAGATGSASDTAAAAAASASVASFLQEPTAITANVPLTTAPPQGKTFIWMKCQLADCTTYADAIKEATEAAGWNYRDISYDQSNPATLVDAMRQALRFNPDYVALSGISPATGWNSVLADYQKAGVKIIVSDLAFPGDLPDPVIANVAGGSNLQISGQAMADWFIADSGGVGKVLLQRVDDYPILKVFADSFASRVAEKCPDCTVTDLQTSIADGASGATVTNVVSQVKSHPDDNYVMSSYGPFIEGLPAALSSAGLSNKVKVASAYSSAITQAQIQRGEVKATTAGMAATVGWMIVDAALRSSEGMNVPTQGFPTPLWILTPDSKFTISNSLDRPTDFTAQYKKLWQVG